jgi:hypothetical protein
MQTIPNIIEKYIPVATYHVGKKWGYLEQIIDNPPFVYPN